MPIDDLLVMEATVTTPGPSGGVNSMGDPVPGPATVTVAPCWCELTSTDEITAGTDLTRAHWRLYTGPATIPHPTSTVTVDAYPDMVFSVDGVPYPAVMPGSGRRSHTETLLVVTAGAA